MNTNIYKLSDNELLRTIKEKKNEESKVTLEVLHLLREVNRRRLFLQQGFSSLWEFATKELGYSSGSAYRRIESMKLLSDFPEYEAKVQTGELPLSILSSLQTFFKEHKKLQTTTEGTQIAHASKVPCLQISEKKELIDQSCGKSHREVEKLIRDKAPEIAISKDREKILSANETEIRFVADEELVELLNRAKDLCGGKNAYPNYNELLKILAKAFLAKKDPLAANPPTPKCFEIKRSDTLGASSRSVSRIPSRYISVEAKRKIYSRAQGTCEYQSPQTGRRCECRRNLEIDHIVEFALGGTNDATNLQLRCVQHHRAKTLQQAKLASAGYTNTAFVLSP